MLVMFPFVDGKQVDLNQLLDIKKKLVALFNEIGMKLDD